MLHKNGAGSDAVGAVSRAQNIERLKNGVDHSLPAKPFQPNLIVATPAAASSRFPKSPLLLPPVRRGAFAPLARHNPCRDLNWLAEQREHRRGSLNSGGA
jgi:hypothetical protein